MTELETMQLAKIYIEKLANGINPLTDQPVPEEDTINHVRISRCLFYVSDVLRKAIENGGVLGKAKGIKKRPFTITQEDLRQYTLSNTPIPVSEITRRINLLVDPSTMTKLKHTSITAFLIQSGFLVQMQSTDGKSSKLPTEQGMSIGILSEMRTGQAGTYRVTVYTPEAQQFILDNIDAVLEINNHASASTATQAELQGQPWTDDSDNALIDLFRKKTPVSKMAVTLKRTESAIRSRLKKLGLTGNIEDRNQTVDK